MCNLYAMLASQDSTRRHFAVDPARDYLGNAEPMIVSPSFSSPRFISDIAKGRS